MALEFIGAVGSPADVATVVIVLVGFREIRARLESVAAGLVAVAGEVEDVDDSLLLVELEVRPEDVEKYVEDPGEDGAD